LWWFGCNWEGGTNRDNLFESKRVRYNRPLDKIVIRGSDMFARRVSVVLKPNSVEEFTRTIKDEVLSLLRKQKGFKDEIAFVASDGTEAGAISLWNQKENAGAYYQTIDSQVLEFLAKVIEGTPEIKTYEVTNSSYHKIAARAAAAS
jgi:hypothetical protein